MTKHQSIHRVLVQAHLRSKHAIQVSYNMKPPSSIRASALRLATSRTKEPIMELPESAFGFRNIKPMTRPERRALRDKVALEKSRLVQRSGPAAKVHRENLPPEGVSLTECTPDAAGFIADADRFHSDTVGEEHLRRKAQHERKAQINESRRQLRVEREGKRWEDMESKDEAAEERWDRLREEGEKSKKNKSGVPYNMINLMYNDGLDGHRLEHNDIMTKHRAQIRSNNLARLGDSRCGYNILTGQPRGDIVDPPRPTTNEDLAHWNRHHAG